MGNIPTPEDIAWMQAHIEDSLVTEIIVCCAVSSGLALVITALRIYARVHTLRKLALSDYAFISSVVSGQRRLPSREDDPEVL